MITIIKNMFLGIFGLIVLLIAGKTLLYFNILDKDIIIVFAFITWTLYIICKIIEEIINDINK